MPVNVILFLEQEMIERDLPTTMFTAKIFANTTSKTANWKQQKSSFELDEHEMWKKLFDIPYGGK